jgi:hypothetical protein
MDILDEEFNENCIRNKNIWRENYKMKVTIKRMKSIKTQNKKWLI